MRFAHPWRNLCGTMYEMPIEPTASELISEATKATKYAQSVRAHHARRTRPGSMQRKVDIDLALERLAAAMKPIRRRIARLPYLTEDGDEIREASLDIQRERRKLWKMTKTKRRR